jgi:hypothetical protein
VAKLVNTPTTVTTPTADADGRARQECVKNAELRVRKA